MNIMRRHNSFLKKEAIVPVPLLIVFWSLGGLLVQELEDAAREDGPKFSNQRAVLQQLTAQI